LLIEVGARLDVRRVEIEDGFAGLEQSLEGQAGASALAQAGPAEGRPEPIDRAPESGGVVARPYRMRLPLATAAHGPSGSSTEPGIGHLLDGQLDQGDPVRIIPGQIGRGTDRL